MSWLYISAAIGSLTAPASAETRWIAELAAGKIAQIVGGVNGYTLADSTGSENPIVEQTLLNPQPSSPLRMSMSEASGILSSKQVPAGTTLTRIELEDSAEGAAPLVVLTANDPSTIASGGRDATLKRVGEYLAANTFPGGEFVEIVDANGTPLVVSYDNAGRVNMGGTYVDPSLPGAHNPNDYSPTVPASSTIQ